MTTMNKCPACKAVLFNANDQLVRCPSCGAALKQDAAQTDLNKTLPLSDATIDSTIDLSDVQSSEADSKNVKPASDTTVDISATMPEAPSPLSTRDASQDTDATAGTIDLGDTGSTPSVDLLGQTIATVEDRDDVSPSATISVGPSGITVGRSTAPLQPSNATAYLGATQRAGGGTTGMSGTSPNSFDRRPDFSIDSNSILSTISKRTLAEGNNNPTTPPDYKIVSKLGEGGMGVVYSAIQKTLDRKVAIKAIKSSKATSEESRRKFFYEAQITSDLDHPNIVPIHDMGSNDDGTLFYSMKMVDGTPWEDAILKKTREENLEIFMKICDAVAFAHSRNIIHRDLKPENVMLGAFGEVLVMDWGLAVDLNTTTTFGMSGTPVYMSPEMAKHDLSKIGKTSDIYILGAILFQIVVGRAPHKGSTVRECLANAAKNNNIETDIEDPLLDIANHAMATEPEDRYATVVEFQEAIREHLRYAQSISLTQRAEHLLESSIASKDYQGFSRALFSMQDAIDLWPGNDAARLGLHRTRMAYGQCALERGDYDLCLQTLDPSDDDEKTIVTLATERKAAIAFREKRFKLMRRAIAALVLFTGISLTIATLYARRQATIAREQEAIATQSAKSERSARLDEAKAKQVAIDERNRAQQAALDEKRAREDEEAAKRIAQAERDKALEAEQQEKLAKEKEVVARQEAVASEKKAIESEQKAVASERTAVQNARYALLGNYQSKLNLALSQTNQFDIERSSQLLTQIKSIEKNLELGAANIATGPVGNLLENWAYRRVALLNNLDLQKTKAAGRITSMDYSVQAKLGILGTSAGEVHLFEIGDRVVTMVLGRSVKLPSSVRSVALSPDGKEALIAIDPTSSAASDHQGLHFWKTDTNLTTAIESIERRDFQQIAFSPNGRWMVAGINGGLWRWERDPSTNLPPQSISCRGTLQCIQFIDDSASEVYGLTTLPNGKSFCLYANLETKELKTSQVPDSLEGKVSTLAVSNEQTQIYFGCIDGRIYTAPNPFRPVEMAPDKVRQATSRPINQLVSFDSDVAPAVTEVLPKKHTTSVRALRIHADGTVMSHSDEPVIHLWRPSADNTSLVYASYVTGLPGNVSNAEFLDSSLDIVGADDRGNIMVWNTAEQDRRRLQARDVPSRLLSQSIAKNGANHSMDELGVLSIGVDKAELSFVGHTPGAIVSDIAVASSHNLVATVAKLTNESIRYSPRSMGSHEVCLWDLDRRRMLHRFSLDTTGACRLAFANSDETLVVGDGKQLFLVPVANPSTLQVETRFGASLSVANPVLPSTTAIIAPSGAVRILDFADATKWDSPSFKYFDLAINNRFAPIESDWSADGKRLYILFENGRIARLDWNGETLANLAWSSEFKSIQTQEQEAPWRYADLRVSSLDQQRDSVQVLIRSSEANSSSQYLKLSWEAGQTSPNVDQEQKFPESMRIAGGATEPVAESKLELANELVELADLAWDSQGQLVTVNRAGTISATDKKQDNRYLLGRPPCRHASHDRDSHHWVTVHDGGIVLLGTVGENDSATWEQVTHSFVDVVQAELSPDGKQLAIIGKGHAKPTSETSLVRYALDSVGKTTVQPGSELSNIRFLRWHPSSESFATIDQEGHWSLRDANGTAEPSEIATSLWNDEWKADQTKFVDAQWLAVRGAADERTNWHLAILSKSKQSSRIDFVPLKQKGQIAFDPIVSKTEIESIAASPIESLICLGDSSGTLSVWFAAPGLDREPRELFTLPGHRGAGICQLSFSDDGSTILSSDDSKRAIQWNSAHSSSMNDSRNEESQ